MKKTLLIGLLFLGVCSNAQISLLNHNIIDNSYCVGAVTNVIPLDIDNDGDLDMISSSDEKIAWQENLDGLGNFGNIHLISDELDGITSVSLADIDNDGDMDIVSTARISNTGSTTYSTIAWHENVGNGDFTIHIIAQDYTGAYYAKAGDMDGDGDLDIVANTNVGSLGWFKNTNGLGNFAAVPVSIVSSGLALTTSFDISDADGDGDKDIVVSSSLTDQYMKAGILLNNGLGTFGAFQVLRNEAPEVNYTIVTRVMFQDLDNDGDADILFFANNRLIALYNAGSGTYPTSAVLYSTFIRDRFRDISVKDMDGDGDPDVVAAMLMYQANNRVLWFENDATHSYTTNHIIQEFSNDGIWSFKVADIDGDGGLDIVTGNNSDNYLVWYKDYTDIRLLGKYCEYPSDPQTADLDGDGDLDVITNVNGGKLVWYENTDGAGTTGLQKMITFQNNNYGYKLGDMDGDGDTDIATDGKWLKNDGTGNFTLQPYVDYYNENGSQVFIADVDADGDNDLIAVDNLSNGNVVIGWYKNLDGTGNFGPRIAIGFANGIFINMVIFDDVDADGDKDIIFSGGKIGVFKNLDGAGTFDTTFQTVYYYQCDAIAFADLDGDGDKDIVTNNLSQGAGNGLSWFKNMDGAGTFTGNPIAISSATLTGITLADMDNDGDIDIVSNKDSGLSTVWLENLAGLGVFGQPADLLVNVYNNSANYVADADSDGKPDIFFVTNSYAGKYAVSWFKNNGLSLNKITGTVKLDLNHDGCSPFDLPVANVKVVTQTSTSDTYATFTAANGYYQFYVDTPGDYTTAVATTLANYFAVSPGSYVTSFTGVNNVQALDFCVADNQTVNDLDVALYPGSEARPGFPAYYYIAYHNKGTTPLSGNVKLQFNALKMFVNSAIPAASSQTSNELTFNFTDLNPFETRMVQVAFQMYSPPVVNLGDALVFTATVNPVADDATPTDNVFQLNQTVIGSYDPNDIAVLEGENISLAEVDNYLHYVIRFQNTGTASAVNITVTNTLDDNLDWDTLQIDGISHNNYVSIRNGNQITFVFKNIYLPAALTNEPGSHGVICYRIKPKNNSVAGDLFHNDAQIYFDYNAAIHTNTVITEVQATLGNRDFGNSTVSLYPNPTTGKVYLATDFEIKSLSVYNIYGQKITGIQNTAEIDLSGYGVGVYFIKIEDAAGKIITKKVVKR